MPWLVLYCAIMAIIIIFLLIKVYLLRKSCDEIRKGIALQLEEDTSALITISTADAAMRRLAGSINRELQLLRSERLRFQSGNQELKDAITNMAHDLRTPLTAICGYLDLLEEEEKSEEAKRYLSFIQNRTLALKQLTEELFRYSVVISAKEELTLEQVNLAATLEESIAAYYAALKKKGITPLIQMPEKKVIRRLNPTALTRIFANVINNVLKYSDGDLTITLFETGEIHFSNTAANLDKVQAEKLFNRFYTVENARKSTGLGLSIAKTLVEQMKGSIFASYHNNRLTIVIRFPADD